MGKTLDGKGYLLVYPLDSVLGPLFFLLYINDLPKNITSDVKLFADDTFLFSVVHNVNRTAIVDFGLGWYTKRQLLFEVYTKH